MPKFNLSLKNLIMSISVLLVFVLIISFFVVNFRNSQKLSDANSSNQSSNNSSFLNVNSLSSEEEAKNSQNSSSSQSSSTNSISQNNSQKNSESTEISITNLANFSNSISVTSNSYKKETQTYQNKFLPNFKLNYPKDWKLETRTIPSSGFYSNILVREIVLTKNNSNIIINLAPIVPTGCSDTEEVPILADLGKFKRYKASKNPYNGRDETNDYYYSKVSYCNLDSKIKSNIQAKDARGTSKEGDQYFKNFIKNYETIDFILSANLESNSLTEIKEADEIIKNSIFE